MPRFTTVFLLIIIASLSSMAQDPKLILPIGHSKGITDVAESANGKWVITSSWDGSVKLWDRYTNKLLHTFQYKDGITGISLSRDNRYLAAGSFDSTVTVWEIGTRKLVRQFGPYTDRMGDVKFLDNTRLSITYADCLPSHVCPSRFMEVWDIAANKLLEAGKGNYYTDDGSLVQFTEKNLVILNKEKKDSVVINIPELKGLYIFRKKWGGYLVWDNNHFYFCDKSGMNKGRVEMNYNIKSVFFSANEEKILLQSGYTPFAELRNFSDTTLIRNFGVNEYDDRSILLAYHPGDDIVYVTAAELDSCYVRDVSGKKRSFDAFPVTANNSTEFRFTKDNKFMYATGANDLLFWELNKNSPSAWFRGYTHPKLRAELALKDSLLLVMSDSTNIEAWEPVQNKLLYTLAETAGPIRTMEISTDQTKFLTLDHQNTIQLWDTRSGKQLQKIRIGSNSSSIGDGGVRWVKSSKPQGDPRIENRFEVPEYVFSTIKLSPNGRYIAGASAEQDGLGIWDLRSGKLVLNLKIGADGVYDCDFSADENKLVAVGRDDRAILLDIPTKTITNLNHDGITISDFVRFAGNQLVLQRDKVFVCFDAATGKEINKTNCTGTLRGFSPDGKMMIVQKDDECQVWDFPISRMISKTKLPEIDRLSFLKDPTKALVSYTYGEAPVLLNLLTGIVERSYPEEMAGKAVYHNQHQLIYTLRDNKVQRWNPLTGKLIASFFSVGKDQFLTQVPAGYYQTSPEAAKLLHYVTKDFKVISFEQLDVKYNRPDKVLTAIGNTDTALIKSYKKAWEKRIRKLRIDTTAFRDGYSVPEADFADRDKIAFEQSNGLLSLHIKGADSIYKIDRFNIWVNESPLFGQRGISLRKKNSNRIDTTIQVQLSQGENRIETSITNVNGTESYRMPLQVNYTPVVKQKEMTRFVGIGIDRFADKNYNLQYSSKDIRDLALKLKEKYGNDLIIDTLFNENVTIEKIKSLKKQLQQSSVNDKVIISYSGHGLLSKDYDYYLSTYSVNFSKPEQNGLAYDELEDLLDSIPARKKLMLIDACHSGEVDKEEMKRISSAEESLKTLGAKGGKPTFTGKTTLGMKNSFELMQSLFVNVGKSTGATIISAAAGTQFALERGDLKNGVFTFSILEALNKNPSLKISELKRIVGERVEQLTNGLQRPTSRNEIIATDWSL